MATTTVRNELSNMDRNWKIKPWANGAVEGRLKSAVGNTVILTTLTLSRRMRGKMCGGRYNAIEGKLLDVDINRGLLTVKTKQEIKLRVGFRLGSKEIVRVVTEGGNVLYEYQALINKDQQQIPIRTLSTMDSSSQHLPESKKSNGNNGTKPKSGLISWDEYMRGVSKAQEERYGVGPIRRKSTA